MTQRVKILIFTSALVLIIGAFLVVIFGFNNQEEKELNVILADLSGQPEGLVVDVSDLPPRELEQEEEGFEVISLTAEEQVQLGIRNFAKDFVERYGSYSNQTNFEGIESLKQQMTPRLQQFTDNYIASIKQDHPYQEGYFGVSTQIVTGEFTYYDPSDNYTSISFSARREEKNQGDISVYNQDVDVELVKVGTEWRVDGIFWK